MTVPELPDLVYIERHLAPLIVGRVIRSVDVSDPVVIRQMVPGDPGHLLSGCTIVSLERHGPFLILRFDNAIHMVVHFMLSGRFALKAKDERPQRKLGGAACLALGLGERSLVYLDDNRMGKIYFCSEDQLAKIPGYHPLAPDLLSPAFTLDYFLSAMGRSRRQVRVFLMDHSLINVVGNAYADEILFEARIHPKRPCATLSDEEKASLFQAILSVMKEGIRAVESAGEEINVKVRDHVRVRNRKGEACPRCGAHIRRANVLGYDSFYCPTCQPWEKDLFSRLPRT